MTVATCKFLWNDGNLPNITCLDNNNVTSL